MRISRLILGLVMVAAAVALLTGHYGEGVTIAAFTIAADLKYFNPIGGQSKRGSGAFTGAPQVFTYKTEDSHATVDDAGYFNAIRDMLSIGDIIDVVVVTNRGTASEALGTYGRHIVKDKSATAVDVTDVTVGTVTDTN